MGADPNGVGTSLYLMPFAISTGVSGQNVKLDTSKLPVVSATGNVHGTDNGTDFSSQWKTSWTIDSPSSDATQYHVHGNMVIENFSAALTSLNLLRLSSNHITGARLDTALNSSCAAAGFTDGGQSPACRPLDPGNGSTGDTMKLTCTHGSNVHHWTPNPKCLGTETAGKDATRPLQFTTSSGSGTGYYDCCKCCGQPQAVKPGYTITISGSANDGTKIPLGVFASWDDKFARDWTEDNVGVQVIVHPDVPSVRGQTLTFEYDIVAFWSPYPGIHYGASVTDLSEASKEVPTAQAWSTCVAACGPEFPVAEFNAMADMACRCFAANSTVTYPKFPVGASVDQVTKDLLNRRLVLVASPPLPDSDRTFVVGISAAKVTNTVQGRTVLILASAAAAGVACIVIWFMACRSRGKSSSMDESSFSESE